MKLGYQDDAVTVYQGDVIEVLSRMTPGTFNTCVTSPPYWALRDYQADGQLGAEPTVDEYVRNMVNVFQLVRRALRTDGTLWLNLGDTYANKQLMGVPWRVALAMQVDGWILRNEIIWHKPNAMPETTRDRLTRDHETLFLFAAGPSYYYDIDAIRVRTGKEPTEEEYAAMRAERGDYLGARSGFENDRGTGKQGKRAGALTHPKGRNRRTVWTINTKPYKGSHTAVFPDDLVEPCILAGSPVGGKVLEPFAGSGTTLAVSKRLGRRAFGIELNPDYLPLVAERCQSVPQAQITEVSA